MRRITSIVHNVHITLCESDSFNLPVGMENLNNNDIQTVRT